MIISAFSLVISLFAPSFCERPPHFSPFINSANVISQKHEVSNYVLLPLSQMRLVSHDFEGYSAAQLTPADFLLIEKKLDEFAIQYNQEAEKRAKQWVERVPALKGRKTSPAMKLVNYKRQYVCGSSKSGDKIVWVNCFCVDNEEILQYWKKQVVFVMDGGNCYFNLKINLTKK